MIKTIDVTVPLSTAVPTFPGDPPFALEPTHSIEGGEPYNVTRLVFGAHSGTHVDAPSHFIAGGGTVDELPLEILIGKARVLDLRGREAIDRADLEALDLRDDLRILFKTRMSGQLRNGTPFQPDFVYLTPEGARYLVDAGIKLVGIDYLSIEKFGSRDFAAHHALLGAGVVVLEGLDLTAAEAGDYDMTCLPLPVVGGDGAPARVVLRTRL